MKMTLHRQQLHLKRTFTISRGSLSTQNSLVVRLEYDGAFGLGEVTENAYYGRTIETMVSDLRAAEHLLPHYVERSPDQVWPDAMALLKDPFAVSALDMAAHDLWARRQGKRLYEAWGLAWENIPDSSYTIGIDTLDTMVAKLQEEPGWSVYKIKLGTPNDRQIVEELRRHTDARFRIDANCAWSVEETLAHAEAMADLGVEFIEQPLSPEASLSDWHRLYEQSPLPIIADENCQTEQDVQRCLGAFHGINVKLCKCGGLTPARRMLTTARQLGMKTMVGCMIESSIGISAAAHLAPLLDYADLDGAVLIRDDPAAGVVIDKGRIVLSEHAGSGATLRSL